MNNEQLSQELILHIANEFDKLKGELKLTYDDDFKAFSLGYTMGIFSTLKSVKYPNRLKGITKRKDNTDDREKV